MDVKQRAINYINIKPRTFAEVKRYLISKGYQEFEVREALRDLEEYHYIDDGQYCQMYFEYGFEKGRGVIRIKRELSDKGVDPEVISEIYEGLKEVPDEFEMAIEICRTVISGIDIEALAYEEKRKLKGRLGRRLASRGFTTEVAYKAIGSIIK